MPKPALRTAICDMLGIEYPIMLAGMGPTVGGVGSAATAPLVAAVSNAGGLGVLGGAGFGPDALREEIGRIRSLTSKPFGVDVLLPANTAMVDPSPADNWRDQVPAETWQAIDAIRRQLDIPEVSRQQPAAQAPRGWRVQDQIEVLFSEQVPVLASGLGNPAPYVQRAHAQGMRVIALVGNVKNARRVAAGGADIVVAQGTEAGGHTGRIGTMALLPQVVDAVAPIPVLAAGGIGDGRGLVAALAMGASGVWCGTAFLATREANIQEWQKQRILEATEEDTRITRLYSGKTMRNITNPLIEAWEASGAKALPMGMQGLLIAELVLGIRQSGKETLLMNAAGQISGLISELRPAAAVVDDMVQGARRVLSEDLPRRVSLEEHAPVTLRTG